MERSLSELVRWAAEQLRDHPQTEEPALIQAMAAEGLSEATARELLAFLPLAFCHAMFPDRPDMFKPHYDAFDPESNRWRHGLLLKDQPLYQQALQLAEQWRAEGVPGPAYLAVAGRSAEFKAINRLLNQGSKLENIRCTPSVVFSKVTEDQAARAKPWWRFWGRTEELA